MDKSNELDESNEVRDALLEFQTVVEKFRKIQENPALYGAENGLTAKELKLLEKIIHLVGEAAIAADEILNRS